MAMYQYCLLPPQHSASHSFPLPLLTPLPSPPVSQACCHGKVIIHKEFQIPPHPLGFGFLVWFFFMLKVCFSVLCVGREGCICLFETLCLGKREVFILELEVLLEEGWYEALHGSSG